MPAASKPTGNSKQRIKSRSGCLKCKKRRVKCDEGLPSCNQCLAKGFECPGYRKPVKWSLKYEVHRPDKPNQTYSWIDIDKELGAATIAFGVDPAPPPAASSDSAPSKAKATVDTGAAKSKPSATSKSKHVTKEKETPKEEDNIVLGVAVAASTWEGSSDFSSEENDAEQPVVAAEDPMEDVLLSSMMNMNGFDFNPPLLDCPVDPQLQDDSWFSPSMNNAFDPFLLPMDPMAMLEAADPNPDDSSATSGFEVVPNSLPPVAGNQATGLIRYYFSEVVPINSCFESADDPLRGDLWILVADSALLYHTVASMAAAHLSRLRSDAKTKALEHQAEALSHLQKEVAKLRRTKTDPDMDMSLSLTPFTPIDKVLISVILIGYSSAWHSGSSLGLSHLNHARPLIRSWLTARFHTTGLLPSNAYIERIPSLLLGMMAYWEALVSFMADQDPTVTDYLAPFADTEGAPLHSTFTPGAKMIPNPWTGICTPILILLTKAGNLVRRRRLLSRMGLGASEADSVLLSHLHEEAVVLERKLRRSAATCIPPAHLVEDTLDARTPVSHLQAMARVYRLVGLLELYRAFPDIAPTTREASNRNHNDAYSELVFDTAVSILTILASIPRGSGVRVFQILPLIVASSALGAAVSGCTASDLEGGILGANGVSIQEEEDAAAGNFHAELGRLTRGPEMVGRWRMFVRGRMGSLCSLVGLPPVEQASKLIEEVWRQLDWETTLGVGDADTEGLGRGKVHWVDVMTEQRLESMF